MSSLDKNNTDSEILALKALEFVIENKVLQTKFLDSSGMSPKTIQNSIQDLDFLIGVLNFLLDNEADLIKFCTMNALDPNQPSIARGFLEKSKKDEAIS